jgi:hypothetical protein
MTYQEISREAADVLGFLVHSAAKPEEKIAILRTAAAAIENTLSAESMKVMLFNLLQKK